MISLIVAYAKNHVIGNKGCIPWRIKGEQKRFKELTTGNVVIMGRRSYEEIGHPLPNRMNIIVSNTKKFEADNCMTAGSLEEAIRLAGDREIFISGGARLYEEAMPLVQKMYVTEIECEVMQMLDKRPDNASSQAQNRGQDAQSPSYPNNNPPSPFPPPQEAQGSDDLPF